MGLIEESFEIRFQSTRILAGPVRIACTCNGAGGTTGTFAVVVGDSVPTTAPSLVVLVVMSAVVAGNSVLASILSLVVPVVSSAVMAGDSVLTTTPSVSVVFGSLVLKTTLSGRVVALVLMSTLSFVFGSFVLTTTLSVVVGVSVLTTTR